MNNGMHVSRGGLALIFVVVFLFGIAVGYIVRDVRADDQVAAAASQAREQVQQTALSVMQRAEEAGATFAGGLTAAAESTKAAVGAVAAPTHAGTDSSSTAPTHLRDQPPKAKDH